MQAAVYPGGGGGDVRCFIVPKFEEVHLWQVERFGHKRQQSNDQVRKLTIDPTRESSRATSNSSFTE